MAARSLDELREGFQVIGYDWRYLYVNPVAAGHGRYSARQLVGRTMMDAYPGIETTAMFAALQTSMNERITQVLENEFTFPDQSARWFEIRVQPVVEGICIYSRDIQHRKAVAMAPAEDNAATEAYVEALIHRWRSWSSGSG